MLQEICLSIIKKKTSLQIKRKQWCMAARLKARAIHLSKPNEFALMSSLSQKGERSQNIIRKSSCPYMLEEISLTKFIVVLLQCIQPHKSRNLRT
jgi:hypothetical protein